VSAGLLARQSERVHTLLRLVTGSMFALHGARKLFGFPTGHMPPVMSQLWIGGVIELVCGVCIFVGFATPIAGLVASGTMAVAYVQFHWMFQLGIELIPLSNRGELALLYSLVFLLIACHGAGKWSIDGWLARPRRAAFDMTPESSSARLR
jgi:putative oxidoreductase